MPPNESTTATKTSRTSKTKNPKPKANNTTQQQHHHHHNHHQQQQQQQQQQKQPLLKTCLPLFVLVLSSLFLSFGLLPPTMRLKSMVSRTGWREKAIVDWKGGFRVPPLYAKSEGKNRNQEGKNRGPKRPSLKKKKFPNSLQSINDELHKQSLVTATHQLGNKCKFINKLIVHLYTFTFRCFCDKESTQTKQQQHLLKGPNRIIHCLHSVPHVCLSLFLFYPLSFFPLLFFPLGFFRLPCGWNRWWAGLADVKRRSLTEQEEAKNLHRCNLFSKREGKNSDPTYQNLKQVLQIWKGSKQSTVERWRAIQALVTATHQSEKKHVSS